MSEEFENEAPEFTNNLDYQEFRDQFRSMINSKLSDELETMKVDMASKMITKSEEE